MSWESTEWSHFGVNDINYVSLSLSFEMFIIPAFIHYQNYFNKTNENVYKQVLLYTKAGTYNYIW